MQRAAPDSAPAGAGRVVLRLVAMVPGGYAATSALVAAGAAALPLAGMARSDAVTIVSLLGIPLYLAIVLWAAAERSLVRLFAVLVAMTAGGSAIALAVLHGLV